jgi:hypothetical protein
VRLEEVLGVGHGRRLVDELDDDGAAGETDARSMALWRRGTPQEERNSVSGETGAAQCARGADPPLLGVAAQAYR